MELSQFTTMKKIADKHGINYYTVRQRIQRHGIPVHREGWQIFVPKSAVRLIVRGKKKTA